MNWSSTLQFGAAVNEIPKVITIKMNDTEVTKLFAELGISNQQAATLRTILLPEARVLLDEFMISNTGDNIEEETDTASTEKEVVNQDLPSIEEGAPSCDDKVSTTDTGYKSDDTCTNLETEGACDDEVSLATEDSSAADDNGYISGDTVNRVKDDSANGYTSDRAVKQRLKDWGVYQRKAVSRQVRELFDVDMTKLGRKRCKRISNILIRMINGTAPLDEMEECNTEVAAAIVNAHRVALGFGSYAVKENEWIVYSKKKKRQHRKEGKGGKGPPQPVADMSDEFTENHKLTMIDYVNFCMDIQGKTKGKIWYAQEEEGDSATDKTPDDKNNHAKEEEDIQESEHTATKTEEEDNGGVTVDLYEYLIEISGEDAVILRPVLHPKARELLDELVSEGTIESAPAENMTLVEEGAVTVDLYDLLVKLNIEDATHLLPALHIKARELLDELISNGTITKKETVSPTKEAVQNNKTSEKASPTSIVDTPNDESGGSVKQLLSDNAPNSTSTNLEVDFKEKCITKRSSEKNSLDPDVYGTRKAELGMTKASSEVLQQRRIIKVSR